MALIALMTGKRSAWRRFVRILAASLYLLTVTVGAAAVLEYVARLRNSFGYIRSSSPRESVFLKQAERLLAQRADRPVEVINFGVPGYNTAQEANLLEDVVAAWDPDLVVLQFCGNDFQLPNFIQTSAGPLVSHSFALHVVLRKLAKHRWPGLKRWGMGYHDDVDVFPVPGLEFSPLDGPEGSPEADGSTDTAWRA